MSTTLRLSGYPAATPVSLTVAGINAAGTGAASAAKSATPGAAAGAAPSLWGAVAHGAELSPAPLAVATWSLDSALVAALPATGSYASPRTVTEDSASIWGRVNASADGSAQTFALTAGQAYPFVAMLKAGTTARARIVIRRPSTGAESRLLANTFATADLSTVVDAGAISGGAVELLADGFIRMYGVFTPDASGDYTFGVGPNGEGTALLYGGALAEPAGAPPPPPVETVPDPFAPDQWQLLDAATDGATLIVRILELPYDGGRPLTFIGYRLNGSDASIGFSAIAPGDYQISVPSLASASVILRAANTLGGVSSEAKTATPTAAATPDPGAADALIASNDIFEGKGALSVPSGQIIALGGVTLSSTTSSETYINGVRLFNANGSQWHAFRWGDLQYVPNGAHDALNADEFTDVAVTWRRTGDVSDRTFTLRVYGSQHTGNDLARGVTPGAAMTLTQTVPAGEVLEVAFTASGAAVTPSLGGVAGNTCPAGRRDVQYLRAPAGGSAALSFSGGTVSNVIARVVLTPGSAASIRRMSAGRSGSTLSLDWRAMPRSGFPDTAGWTEFGGTPAAPEVRDRNSGPTGFQLPTGFVEWKRVNGPGVSFFAHDFRITAANTVVKIKNGFANALIYDAEGYGPTWSGSSRVTQGQFIKPLENTSTWPDTGVLRVYDTIYDRKETVFTGASNNESLDGDAYIRNMLIKLYFMNGDWRNTGDAIADMKGAAQFHCMTFGKSWRAIRAWSHATLYGRTRMDGPYTQADANISHRGGILNLWMTDRPGGQRVYDYTDLVNLESSSGLSAFGFVADVRQAVIAKAKPAFAPECDYAATDFEFEQSLNGGASWSPLTVERTGPNDCWGATRRTVTGVSTSITHVRARARWGAKFGTWAQVAVTG